MGKLRLEAPVRQRQQQRPEHPYARWTRMRNAFVRGLFFSFHSSFTLGLCPPQLRSGFHRIRKTHVAFHPASPSQAFFHTSFFSSSFSSQVARASQRASLTFSHAISAACRAPASQSHRTCLPRPNPHPSSPLLQALSLALSCAKWPLPPENLTTLMRP